MVVFHVAVVRAMVDMSHCHIRWRRQVFISFRWQFYENRNKLKSLWNWSKRFPCTHVHTASNHHHPHRGGLFYFSFAHCWCHRPATWFACFAWCSWQENRTSCSMRWTWVRRYARYQSADLAVTLISRSCEFRCAHLFFVIWMRMLTCIIFHITDVAQTKAFRYLFQANQPAARSIEHRTPTLTWSRGCSDFSIYARARRTHLNCGWNRILQYTNTTTLVQRWLTK